MLDTYSGATRVIFIVGDPIAQVKSPGGVTQMLRDRGADLVVVPAHVAVADLAAWVASAQAMRNCVGIIVTVPHKFAALALCRSASAQAARGRPSRMRLSTLAWARWPCTTCSKPCAS